MKENTKFLWMYVGILFSFAIILIVFAGFSQDNDAKQTKGLKNDITQLSEWNTELNTALKTKENEIKKLNKTIEDLNKEKETLTVQNTNLTTASETNRLNDVILMEAITLYDAKKFEDAKSKILNLNPETLAESQKYIYNVILNSSAKK